MAASKSSDNERIQKKNQDHLKKQDASTVDPKKLSALTPEVVSSPIHSICLFEKTILFLLVEYVVIDCFHSCDGFRLIFEYVWLEIPTECLIRIFS